MKAFITKVKCWFASARRGLEASIDFLLPSFTCVACGREVNAPKHVLICDKCAEMLIMNTDFPTLRDRKEKQWFYRAYAPFRYDGVAKTMILALKHGGRGEVAIAVAPFMIEAYRKGGGAEEPILIPVPLYKWRFRARGYNQAALVAKGISKLSGYSVDENVLKRIKKTVPQVEMTTKERAANQHGAFAVEDKAAVEGKNIILVDDVFTSGSTTNECARVLMRAGAHQVEVLTIANANFIHSDKNEKEQ